MLTSVARVLHRTHKKWRVSKEMEGWMVRKSIQPSSSDGDDEDDESGNDCQCRKPRPLSTQKQCTGYPCRLLCSARKRKGLSSVKKTTAVLKKAMAEKSEKWKSREWYGTTKTRWQQPAGNSGGQSSLDAWEHAKPKGKWKEVSP